MFLTAQFELIISFFDLGGDEKFMEIAGNFGKAAIRLRTLVMFAGSYVIIIKSMRNIFLPREQENVSSKKDSKL